MSNYYANQNLSEGTEKPYQTLHVPNYDSTQPVYHDLGGQRHSNVGNDLDGDYLTPTGMPDYLTLEDDHIDLEVYNTIPDNHFNNRPKPPLPKERKPKPKSNTPKIIGIVVGILGAMVIGGILVYFFVPRIGNSQETSVGETTKTADEIPTTTQTTERSVVSVSTSTSSQSGTNSPFITGPSSAPGTTTGGPSTTSLNNPNPSAFTVDSCMNASDCWVQYNFLHDDIYYDCSEGKYIRWLTNYQEYVGVKVCGERRYQIFLSRNGISGMFENVGDIYGYRGEPCEFLGGAMNGTAPTPYQFHETKGFKRRDWGESVSYSDLRYCYSIDCGSRGAWIVPWIQCPDVDIPGVNSIVQMDGRHPPTDRECYLSATPMDEFSTSRHNTTPPRAITGESPSSFVFWCSTNQVTDYEVHVLSLYESSVIYLYNGTYDTPSDFPIPFDLFIKAAAPGKPHYPVKLILASFSAVQWDIQVEEGVNIHQIYVVSIYPDDVIVNMTRQGSPYTPTSVPISRERKSLGRGRRNPRDMKDYVETEFGAITSFMGRYSPTGYSLRVGV